MKPKKINLKNSNETYIIKLLKTKDKEKQPENQTLPIEENNLKQQPRKELHKDMHP